LQAAEDDRRRDCQFQLHIRGFRKSGGDIFLRGLEEAQKRYVQQQAPDAEMKLVREIVQRVWFFADHPDAGRIAPDFKQSILRDFILSPFQIVYWQLAAG
jgi:hypothetical protein